MLFRSVHLYLRRERQYTATLHADPHARRPGYPVGDEHLVPVQDHAAVCGLRQPPGSEDLELQSGQVDGEKYAHGAKTGQVLVEVGWTEALRVLDLVAS